MTACAVLVPGYRGSARQPIVLAIAKRLDAVGVASKVAVLSTSPRPSLGYREEVAALRAVRDQVLAAHGGPVALIGRSFGGRMCALLAAEEPPDALAIVGHPISPPGRPRPRDEAALAAVRCPTLVVQGDRDDLGPLAVLERVAAGNPLIDLIVLRGAAHELRGPEEAEAAEHVGRWVAGMLGIVGEAGRP
ncbi:MAG: hypothetical protein KGN00_07165 [Chloroflexota bacterium]|nr:hypothetical protein [Chloroflexota bacterium]MDE3193450.1 hypothetical protein [Chloroflexota bacterium]